MRVRAGSTKLKATRAQFLDLSIEQRNAIDLLVTGISDRETAERTGVARETVTKWRLYHPGFIAELNGRRSEVGGASVDKMRMLIPKALEVIDETLDDGANPNRWKAAIELLKVAKASEIDLNRIGPDKAEEIIQHLADNEEIDNELSSFSAGNREKEIAISKILQKLTPLDEGQKKEKR